MDLLYFDYINSGMLILIPGLYFFGQALKISPLKDWLIPFVLGLSGIVMSFAWHMGIGGEFGAKLVFDSITQGLLCAAGSVYIKNISAQLKKRIDNENKDKKLF